MDTENNIVAIPINNEPVCDFRYLNDLVNGKSNLIIGIMDVFIKQIPEDLQCIKEAITTSDYKTIKIYTHTMKSSVSIMGISVLKPILNEMENLGKTETGIEIIKQLYEKLMAICVMAIGEIEIEKLDSVQSVLKQQANKTKKS